MALKLSLSSFANVNSHSQPDNKTQDAQKSYEIFGKSWHLIWDLFILSMLLAVSGSQKLAELILLLRNYSCQHIILFKSIDTDKGEDM